MPARISIYLADDLRRRMDKVKGVNWSAVAAEAFERKLGELAAQKQEKKMEDVIQRLRASKLEDDSEIVAQGRHDGHAWAKDGATAAELKRLAKYMDRFEAALQGEQFTCGSESDAYCGAERFVFEIDPNAGNDRMVASDFWEGVTGENEYPDNEYVQAFAEGAMALWSEVADKL